MKPPKSLLFFFAISIHFCSYNVLIWFFQQMKITTEGGAKRCFFIVCLLWALKRWFSLLARARITLEILFFCFHICHKSHHSLLVLSEDEGEISVVLKKMSVVFGKMWLILEEMWLILEKMWLVLPRRWEV